MSSDETVAAAGARLAGPSVRLQSFSEPAPVSAGVAVVAKAGAPGLDGFLENSHERIMKSRSLAGGEGGGGAGRVDSGPPQSFVRVDVPYSGDGLLVHQHLFDGLA